MIPVMRKQKLLFLLFLAILMASLVVTFLRIARYIIRNRTLQSSACSSFNLVLV